MNKSALIEFVDIIRGCILAKENSEVMKLQKWLEKNNLKPDEAKKILQNIRNNRARKYTTHSHDFSGKHIKIGIVGDTHFGNKWTDKQFLNEIMNQFKRDKVEAVYHVGDLVDGPWQKHRNVLEQYVHGFDAQIKDFVNDFPDTGIRTYFILGNHDLWFMKQDGGNVGKVVDMMRGDLHYLGDEEARIKIGKVEIMLNHPDDATSYAYSYKPQKLLESMFRMGESMPDILLIGHYHKAFYMYNAGVHVCLTGTTCRQTPWMRGKKIAADMAAYEFDIYRNSRGGISKLELTLLPHVGEKHKPAIK